MTERDIQKLILLRLTKEYHPRGQFWTRDVGKFITPDSIKGAIKAILSGADPIKTLKKLRRISIGKEGEPDISGCLDGLWIGIEVKKPGNGQQQNQKDFQVRIERAGGIYVIARSPDEVIEMIEAALAHRRRLISC